MHTQHYHLQESIAFQDLAHKWRTIYGHRKKTDGWTDTYEFPTQPNPPRFPLPFFAHGRTDRHTIIDTHHVLGIFWTENQDPTEPGLASLLFLLFF